MPTNEILAPVYVVGKYATPAYPTGHQMRIYFQTGTTLVPGLTGDEDNWRVMRGGDDKGSIADLMSDVMQRAGGLVPDNTSWVELALWHSVPSAPNVLDHFNTLPTGNSYGVGVGIAAAYTMYVFAGALVPKFRLNYFDGAQVNPQRYPPNPVPNADDGSIEWLFEKSDWGLATQDGIKLIRGVSVNTGYNRKLAKSYGRTITP